MSRRNKQAATSNFQNNLDFVLFKTRLEALAMTVFEWDNLPNTINRRFLEQTLLRCGSIAIFYDDVLGYLALPFSTANQLDLYDNPTEIYAYANNGYHKHLKADECVIVYDNITRKSLLPEINTFSRRLYNLDRTIDVNVNAQKTPILLQASETQRLSIKNIYMQYEGNEPFIFATDGLNPNVLQVLKTDSPFVSDKLYELKSSIWNEFLTYIGIANVSVNKKERLITDEVQRSQGGVIASRNIRLSTREFACEELKEKFNLDVKVIVKDGFDTKKESDVVEDE